MEEGVWVGILLHVGGRSVVIYGRMVYGLRRNFRANKGSLGIDML